MELDFFQIGGGIAEISQFVVPMLYQDMEMPETFWSCQISDSTTSYGLILELFRMKKLLGVN
jgi:hypothetical protein